MGSGSEGRLTQAPVPDGPYAMVTEATPLAAEAAAATSTLPEPRAVASMAVGIVNSVVGELHDEGVVIEAACDSVLSLPTGSTALTL